MQHIQTLAYQVCIIPIGGLSNFRIKEAKSTCQTKRYVRVGAKVFHVVFDEK